MAPVPSFGPLTQQNPCISSKAPTVGWNPPTKWTCICWSLPRFEISSKVHNTGPMGFAFVGVLRLKLCAPIQLLCSSLTPWRPPQQVPHIVVLQMCHRCRIGVTQESHRSPRCHTRVNAPPHFGSVAGIGRSAWAHDGLRSAPAAHQDPDAAAPPPSLSTRRTDFSIVNSLSQKNLEKLLNGFYVALPTRDFLDPWGTDGMESHQC